MSLGLGEGKWECCDEEQLQKHPCRGQGISRSSDKPTQGQCWGQTSQSEEQAPGWAGTRCLLPPCFKGTGLCTSFVKKPACTSNITTHHLFPKGLCALANCTDPGEPWDKYENFLRGGCFIADFRQELSLSQQKLSPPETEETPHIRATRTSLLALRH